MERYKNYSGDSGVSAFDTAPNYIDVRFNNGSVYRYTYNSTGAQAVEEMKRLAFSGRGLNCYISIYVKKAYAAKLR